MDDDLKKPPDPGKETEIRSHNFSDEQEGVSQSSSTQMKEEGTVVIGGRYEIETELGSGGMGTVYLAYDRVLQRKVALKILAMHNKEQLRYFMREARVQAQIDHPHVCKIYDVGIEKNMPYLAMQYIRGYMLDDMMEELTIEEKVMIMAKIAEAVHEVHKHGIIHRDIKPSNIMVEVTEQGQYHPYILDFGVARLQNTSTQTEIDVIKGTPYYMAPEQAKGDVKSIGRHTDVYGLGVTLYELLTLSRPYEGDSSIEVLMKILQREPEPLRQRNPHVPVDLEIIVMKSISQEVSKRYSSARALAEDLQRYLRGEPISARSPTITYRISRWVKRNRILATMLLILTVVTVTWVSLLIYQTQRHRWITQKLESFVSEASEVRALLSYIYMQPSHDIRKPLRQLIERVDKLEKQLKEIGSVGEYAGYKALGEVYLALHNYPRALAYFEKMKEKGKLTSDAAVAYSIALGELYYQEKQILERIKNKQEQERLKRVLHNKYLSPATQALQFALKHHGTTAREYVEALWHFYSGYNKRAEELALYVIKNSYWSYLARIGGYKILIKLYQDQANKAFAQGYTKEGLKYLDNMKNFLQQALLIGRSDPSLHELNCNFVYLKALYNYWQKNFPNVWKSNEHVCKKALEIHPSSPRLLLATASYYNIMGQYLSSQGIKDGETYLRKAIERAEQAKRLDPDNPYTYLTLGSCWSEIADLQLLAGQGNPLSSIQKSIVYLKKAKELQPENINVNEDICYVYSTLGDIYRHTGGNPIKAYQDGIDLCENAVKKHPNLIVLRHPLVDLYTGLSTYLIEKGKDPSLYLQRATEHLQDILARQEDAVVYINLGYSYRLLAAYKVEHDQDPTDTIDKALTYLQDGWNKYPHNFRFPANIGVIYTLKGEYTLKKGKQPFEDIRAAKEYLAKALQMAPNVAPLRQRATLPILTALKYIKQRGGNPYPWFKEGESLVKPLVKTANSSLESIYTWIVLNRLMAEIEQIANKPYKHYIAEAGRSLKRAQKLDPNDFRLYIENLRLNLINWDPNSKWSKEVEKIYNHLQKIWQKAAKLGKSHSEIHYIGSFINYTFLRSRLNNRCKWEMGTCVRDKIKLTKETSYQIDKAIEEGLQRIATALEINPNFAKALALRAVLNSMKAQWQGVSRDKWINQLKVEAERLNSLNPYVLLDFNTFFCKYTTCPPYPKIQGKV